MSITRYTSGNWHYRMHVSDQGLICFTMSGCTGSESGWLTVKEAKQLRKDLKAAIKELETGGPRRMQIEPE